MTNKLKRIRLFTIIIIHQISVDYMYAIRDYIDSMVRH